MTQRPRKIYRSRSLVLTLALASLVAFACGNAPPSRCSYSDFNRMPCEKGQCRVFPKVKMANPIQCATASDCGIRPHTEDMMCISGGYCIAVCEDHWGNCNDDYRDGCETPIKHRLYCDGNPRINEVAEPMAGFFAEDEGVGPGRFDWRAFALGLGEHNPRLEKCYKKLLTTTTDLNGVIVYKFTLGESGRITSAKVVRNNTGSRQLEACVADVATNMCFDQGPKGGPITYTYRVVFSSGAAAGEE